MKSRILLSLAIAAIGLSACLDTSTTTPEVRCSVVAIPELEGDTVTTSTGLQYLVRTEGTGDTAQVNSTVTLNYAGYLPDGTLFDRGTRLTFTLSDDIIDGFREGVTGMQTGGSRRLIVPPSLAYGEQSGGCIPVNATLIFDIDLLDIID